MNCPLCNNSKFIKLRDYNICDLSIKWKSSFGFDPFLNTKMDKKMYPSTLFSSMGGFACERITRMKKVEKPIKKTAKLKNTAFRVMVLLLNL